jgi:hypothetical protein
VREEFQLSEKRQEEQFEHHAKRQRMEIRADVSDLLGVGNSIDFKTGTARGEKLLQQLEKDKVYHRIESFHGATVLTSEQQQLAE